MPTWLKLWWWHLCADWEYQSYLLASERKSPIGVEFARRNYNALIDKIRDVKPTDPRPKLY